MGIVVGVVCLILPGIVFALQGANVLPGSVMTGDPMWIRNGIILIVMGIALIGITQWLTRRKEQQ